VQIISKKTKERISAKYKSSIGNNSLTQTLSVMGFTRRAIIFMFLFSSAFIVGTLLFLYTQNSTAFFFWLLLVFPLVLIAILLGYVIFKSG
jgi:hypothetical protein